MRNLCVVMLSLAFITACSSQSKIEKNGCSDGRTILDGVCVKNEIADYVSCVRAQGMTLVNDKSHDLSVDAGYFGIKASGASEVSERLERQYKTSDEAMTNIINNCNKLAGIPTRTSELESDKFVEEAALSDKDLSGYYRYMGSGGVRLKQTGNKVHMYLTWSPQGKGPHYEVKGTLKGNKIEGEWYSIVADRGWYYFQGEVSETGRSIDFSGSEDPIGSNMGRLRIMKN